MYLFTICISSSEKKSILIFWPLKKKFEIAGMLYYVSFSVLNSDLHKLQIVTGQSNAVCPHQGNTILLTIFLLQYKAIPVTCLCWRFVPLNPLHLFCPSPSLPSGIHPFILCIYVSFALFVLFLNSMYKWDCMVFVFLCQTRFT